MSRWISLQYEVVFCPLGVLVIGVFRVNEANLHKLYERRHCEVPVHHVYLAHENKDEAVQNAFLDDIGAHYGIMRFPSFMRKIDMMHKNLARSTFIHLM